MRFHFLFSLHLYQCCYPDYTLEKIEVYNKVTIINSNANT